MNNGKNICKYLKEVRKNIANENNIPLEQEECTFEGECNGTCPHCEAEVQYIEQELSKKGKMNILGKAATIAGLSLSMAACTPKISEPLTGLIIDNTNVESDSTQNKPATDSIIEIPEKDLRLMGDVCAPVREQPE